MSMLNFKKYNYFTGDVNHVSNGISKISKFMELEGHSFLLLTLSSTNTVVKSSMRTSLKHLINNQINFENIDDFKKICEDTSNFFRLNILILDFWHLRESDIEEYKKLIKSIKVDHFFIVANQYHYKSTDDSLDIELIEEYDKNSSLHNWSSELYIKDKSNNSKYSFSSLKKSHIRDIKINKLFDDSE
jgi:hypothetical protein